MTTEVSSTSTPQPIPTTNTPQPTTTTTATEKPNPKTPVTLSATSHLDPSAYVRGSSAITIHQNVLIHPRAHLISTHSALTIQEGSIISTKSIIGGPLPPSTAGSQDQPRPSSNPTTISANTHIHANVTIHSGAYINSHVVIESNATIDHDVRVGRHSKICAGVTVTRDVPDWTVVYGGVNGEVRTRRRRRVEGEGEEGEDPTEAARLLGMVREREAAMAILKRAAARSLAAKARR